MFPLPDPPRKLLFDENLSARIVPAVADAFPGSPHVGAIGLAGSGDYRIWDHAKLHLFAIVTKDQDYHRLSVLYGAPPKVVWIRLGNCSTEDVIDLLQARTAEITAFLLAEDGAFLALA